MSQNVNTYFPKSDKTFPPSKEHEFLESDVRSLDPESWSRVKTLFQRRFGDVVFRRVAKVDSKAKAYHVVHSPAGKRTISDREARSLDWEEFFRTTTTEVRGPYSFVTSQENALPAHDVFRGEAIYGSSEGRSELDPVTLRLVPAKGPAPRVSLRVSPEQDDPFSLVMGTVARKGGRLVFTRWTVASFQMIWMVLLCLHSEDEVPFAKGQYKSPETSRAYWLSGNRGCSNEFRRVWISEKHSGTPLSPEEAQKHFKIPITGADTYCHIWAMWVLMVRYGELPSPANIPTIVPPPVPNDPVKRAAHYTVKPIKFWDLPFASLEGTKVKLDRFLVSHLGLKWVWTATRLPVHRKSLRPELSNFVEPTAEEALEVPGTRVLVPSRPSSPVLSQTLEGLSQDSDDEVDDGALAVASRSPSPDAAVAFAWADREEEVMDFEKPVEAGGLWKSMSVSLVSLLSSLSG